MARRVFLHIGLMKSATTYVQGLADHNVATLGASGVLWTQAKDYFLATSDLLGTRHQRPGLDGAWATLDSRLRAHDGDALISNELLAPLKPRKIAKLVKALAPAEVRVIVTARDLGRVIPSQWQTGTRNRHTIAWTDYVEQLRLDDGNETAAAFWRRQDIAHVIDSWSRQVPLEQITLVTVPGAGSGAALLWERFASVLGVDPAAFAQPPISNPSVGAYSAELLRRLNVRTAGVEWLHYRSAFKTTLARTVLSERAPQEPPITLSRDELAWARNRAGRLVEAVAATGVRVVGDLKDLIPGEHRDIPVVDPAKTTDAQLLATSMDALVGMGQVHAEVKAELEALVRVVELRFFPGDVDSDDVDRIEALTAYEDYERSLGEPPMSSNGRSRFLRWRLAQRARPDG